jgi:hypothetical protein
MYQSLMEKLMNYHRPKLRLTQAESTEIRPVELLGAWEGNAEIQKDELGLKVTLEIRPSRALTEDSAPRKMEAALIVHAAVSIDEIFERSLAFDEAPSDPES